LNDNAMSVLQHLGELKRRLVRVAIVAVVFIAIAIAFYVQIFEVFTDTARRLIVDVDGVVAVQRITEGWVVAAKLAILVGLVRRAQVHILAGAGVDGDVRTGCRVFLVHSDPQAGRVSTQALAAHRRSADYCRTPRRADGHHHVLARNHFRNSDLHVPAGKDGHSYLGMGQDEAAVDDPYLIHLRCGGNADGSDFSTDSGGPDLAAI